MMCLIDDKHVPVYRILWVSDIPHFCGSEECDVEGRYEVRLDQGDALFGTRDERDHAIDMLQRWQNGDEEPPPGDPEDDPLGRCSPVLQPAVASSSRSARIPASREMLALLEMGLVEWGIPFSIISPGPLAGSNFGALPRG